MLRSSDSVITLIRFHYNRMTSVEQTISNYFLSNPAPDDLTLHHISDVLFVSKPSLSRFAQTLGFEGFRELVYQYKQDRIELERLNAFGSATTIVFENYLHIIHQIIEQVDEEQLWKALNIIKDSKHIYIHGDGLSGMAANEFMVRFKRLGFPAEVYTSDFLMHINSTSVQENMLVIGLTLSGHTKSTVYSMRKAHESGAKTLLITSNHDLEKTSDYDVILFTASLPHMNTGINISPQLPMLLIIDLLFNNYVNISPEQNLKAYKDTISVLKYNWLEHP